MDEDAGGLAGVRFVVLDTESTGFDPRTDRIVSIGAVAVAEGEIRLDDAFEAVLRISHNTSAVTVHGVTRDEGRHGLEEAQALHLFWSFVGAAVLVGHHLEHDVALLDAAGARHGRARAASPTLDTAELAGRLADAGHLPGGPLDDLSLDALCARFAIEPRDRHTAAGDAFLTARVLLRLLRASRRAGFGTLDRLVVPPRPSA